MSSDSPVTNRAPEDLPEPDPDKISIGVISDPDAAQQAWIDSLKDSKSEMASVLRNAAVTRALTQVGVVENPEGSNCGIPHELYQMWIAGPGVGCVPWCAFFVGWAFDTSAAGNHDHKAPWGTSGYVPWIYNWAQTQGKLVASPAHGDIFFVNPTDPIHSHMGLVVGADPKMRHIYTCEGNSSDRLLSQLRSYDSGDYAFARL